MILKKKTKKKALELIKLSKIKIKLRSFKSSKYINEKSDGP